MIVVQREVSDRSQVCDICIAEGGIEIRCIIEGCDNIRHKKNELCRRHYFEKTKSDRCEVCDSNLYVFRNNATGMMLCNKHAQQVKRRGKILTRTLLSPNDFIFHDSDDSVKIVMYDKNGEVSGSTLIDVDDYEKCKQYKWRLHSMGYAATGDDSEILLHRHIMNIKDDRQIDHKDRDGLNNRKLNLRITTQSLNMVNKSMQSNNTSGVVGVGWNKEKVGWDVQLQKGDVKKNRRFKSFDKAVLERLKLESLYFKKHSPNYNHDEGTIQIDYLSHDDNKYTYLELDLNGKIIENKKRTKQ